MGIREAQAQVREFHEAFDLSSGDERDPQFINVDLRVELIREEFTELQKAIDENDLPAAADAVIDLLFVTLGTGVEWGLDLEPLWQEVCRTNMAKRGGRRRSDGKWIKPPDWQPPNIAALIEAQRERFAARPEEANLSRGERMVRAAYRHRCPFCGAAPSAPCVVTGGIANGFETDQHYARWLLGRAVVEAQEAAP